MLGCTQGTFNFAIIQKKKICQFIFFSPVCALELSSSGLSGSSLGFYLFQRQPFEEGAGELFVQSVGGQAHHTSGCSRAGGSE